MNILLIGGGGREHALAWKLAQSPRVERLWVAPGNGGIAGEVTAGGVPVECVPVGAEDLEALLDFAVAHQPELTVVGPDNPLAAGIVDLFEENNLRIWGPNAAAAQFESSKVFAQDFMARHSIPTARAGTFNFPTAAKAFAGELDGRCVVKADGLALGKGVLICETLEEAEAAIDSVMVDQQFGEAGDQVVIQEFLEGTEISLHVMCDGRTTILFPTSQDHKRALDGDKGLNTGGMGTFSPAPFLSDEDLAQAARAIIDPWLLGCQVEEIDFRGMLYPGLMLTDEGPKVLEFNARWGDPETQVYLMRLETDLVDLFEASIDRRLAEMDVHWSDQAAVCVVMASGGYPESYAKGKPITGIADADAMEGVKVFHAGTKYEGKNLVTSGGRVLGVTALGDTLAAARDLAYAAVDKIKFEGAHVRGDIAAKALTD
ncbi:MAG TPA: phosphoribosylamine--glycine ligase [Verrucomicrobiales bacterium]|nr:phosphoribosylamine--glycine ligase [Verrucomicrobiales bacterium]HIL24024.1 phosphoribosylamine--glycine ligase [Verrucomicrobiota bacterium]